MPKHIVPENIIVCACVKLLVNFPTSPDVKYIIRLIGCLQGLKALFISQHNLTHTLYTGIK